MSPGLAASVLGEASHRGRSEPAGLRELGRQVTQAEGGRSETGPGRSWTSGHCPPLPWWQASWEPSELRRKTAKIHTRGKNGRDALGPLSQEVLPIF